MKDASVTLSDLFPDKAREPLVLTCGRITSTGPVFGACALKPVSEAIVFIASESGAWHPCSSVLSLGGPVWKHPSHVRQTQAT